MSSKIIKPNAKQIPENYLYSKTSRVCMRRQLNAEWILRTSIAPTIGATASATNIDAVKELGLDDNGEQIPTLSSLMCEIRLLRNDILDVKNQISAVSLNFSMQNAEFEEKIDKQEKEIALLKEALAEFRSTAAQQEQYNVRNELEVVGIPEQNNENLTHIILLSSKKLGVELQAADIDEVRRVGTKQHEAGPAKKSLPRPIVVKLLRKSKRDEMVAASVVRKNLTTEGIVTGTADRIYLNERLSASNRKLFREARIRSKLHNFKHCWVRNGVIYVRKFTNTKDRKCQAFSIRSEEDLLKYIGPSVTAEEPPRSPKTVSGST
ncbi:hypothetical protein NE865_00223 [Phthorimaea operculella]|nr:hypothetical protein NE865_00223 [Phthorimaea operculella]